MGSIKFILLLIVFLTPLLSPVKNLGYEQTKVFFFIILLTIAGILWTIYSLKYKVKTAWTPIQKAATLFIAILFLTSVLGVDRWNSFLGTQPYFQGWILYAYLYLFFLLVSWSKIKLKNWAYVLVGSASLVGILAIHQWILLNVLNQSIPTYAGRVVSSFGQPNFYSGFLLLTLPFFLFLLESRRIFKGWIIVGFLIAISAIVLSESRSAYFLMAILMLYWLIKEFKRTRVVISAIILAVVLVAIFSSTYLSSGFVWKEVISPTKTTNPDLTKASVENRAYIWPQVWQIILEKPLFGYGLENISLVFSRYFIENKHALFEENLEVSPIQLSLKELNIDRSHNYLLDLLLFSGILGLGAWIFLVFALFIQAGRSTNVLLVPLVLCLVWIQFQNQSVVHLIYFWLLAGLINTNIDKHREM